jgi:protocatechuate 3,4-dioxygenase beta subunit
LSTPSSAVATTSAISQSVASCSLTPEGEEGPFYVTGQTIRQDVTYGKPGLPLLLQMTLMDSASCKPLANAAVDLWQADAVGTYSSGSGGELFLRGTQLSDANGLVKFSTIYPGWYPGRTPHIHVKVHVGGQTGATYSGGHVAHTGQLYFPEDLSDQVYKQAPYSTHTGRRTPQAQDAVFANEHGSATILQLAAHPSSGYTAAITLTLDPNATPAPVGAGGGGGPGPRS